MTMLERSMLFLRRHWRTLLLLLLLLGMALGFQGTRGIWSPDEGYHAVIARTMLESGGWLIPHVGYQVWLDKPPLSHWGMVAGMRLLGTNQWGVRLSHALWYVLTTLLVFALGRDFWNARSGRLAAVLYATMLIPFAAANVLTPDTPLTFWTTAAMACFWFARDRSRPGAGWWKLLLGVTLGLGVWTKGPAALIPGAAMLAFLVISRSVRSFFVSWRPVVGGVLFLTIASSWYVYVGVVLPGSLEYLWDNHVVGRLVSASYGRHPGLSGVLHVYLPVLLGGALPASAVWIPAVKRRWRVLLRRCFWQRLRNDPGDLMIACWIVVPCLVLAAASSKLPLYLLPVFPALALLTARLLRSETEARGGTVGFIGLPAGWSWPLGLWVCTLMAMKLVGGLVDDHRDMGLLARQLREIVPPSAYEIVCVHLRCEGVVFYLGNAVERVALNSRPYPVYGGTEPLSEEVRELPQAAYHHVLVYDASRESAVRSVLSQYSAWCSQEAAPLGHDRRAIVCTAAQDVVREIVPEPHQLGRAPPTP
jgi:4-amino-4-deoxy-L-arabinose transferase-like glycosyltransferase